MEAAWSLCSKVVPPYRRMPWSLAAMAMTRPVERLAPSANLARNYGPIVMDEV
jgi:hypothetical protein